MKKEKQLYEIGKKNFGSYSNPEADKVFRFTDFKPYFYEEYIKAKRKSLLEELEGEGKEMTLSKYKTILIAKFKENCPDFTNKEIATGFGISESEFYRRMQTYKGIHTP